jgi:hypothetical protein
LEDTVCVANCLKLLGSIGIVWIFVWMRAQRKLEIIYIAIAVKAMLHESLTCLYADLTSSRVAP